MPKRPAPTPDDATRALLRRLADALDLAFDYDGDVFGRHHNDVVDLIAEARIAALPPRNRRQPET